jgi:uncharacterized protein YhaN
VILHRLRLQNFRGVADRDIAFPDRGVVVVCGPNEIGKSSMLEALDLLLSYKDRSGHRDVKAVKPTHVDAGALIEAEISTGEYRFVYRKRFHKKQMTELDISAPRREQLTGDEAHDRVEAIIAETVDLRLWEAQRVLQSASTDAVNLSGSDALARALDAAAGDAAAPAAAGADPASLLIDRIESEYLRYFTATGRPTKEWKAAGERLAVAEAEVRQRRSRVEEVDQRVSRHDELGLAVRALQDRLTPAAARLTHAQQAHAGVLEITEGLANARLQAEAAAATAAGAALADRQRRELIADAARRAETLTELQNRLTAAVDEETQARQAADAAATATDQADAALAAAQATLDTAQAAVVAAKLAARVTRIDATEASLVDLRAQIGAIGVTGERLADIEQAAALADRLQAQLESDAAIVEFIAPAGVALTIDGVARTLSPAEVLTQPATAAVVVDVPGVLSVRINPGATAVTLRANLAAAQTVLGDALAEAGVSDVAAARSAAQQRQTLTADVARLSAALEVLLDGDDSTALHARLAELPGDAAAGGTDVAAAAADLAAARAAADARRASATDAASALTATSTGAGLLRQRIETAETELADVRDRLAIARTAVADDAVAAEATARDAALRAADTAVAALAQRYAAADPVAVEAELAAAAAEATAIADEHDRLATELNTITIELGVMGGEGRQGDLDEAEAELERAAVEHARLGERAAATQLLRDTMIRHRDNARARYVQPYRAELERLGRVVFGESFAVEVNAALTICSRSLDGCTVPYESLSGGAREQLGILARLAGAALVAKEDTVPVMIDDALGFTDPDRLARMAAVFDTVGDRGQVIVLTCTPGRYDGIAEAEVIELSA